MRWNREDATRLGLEAATSEYFGNAWRIGGATDLLSAPADGAEITVAQATSLIKAKGRWWSDIYQIYSRWLLSDHAAASRAIATASGDNTGQVGLI